MSFSKNSAESKYLTSYNDFITSLLPNDLVLEIEYESNSVSGNAVFYATFNGAVIHEIHVTNETSKISLNLIPSNLRQVLELSMIGKGTNDTVMQNDIMLQDTFFKFVDFKINNYKLLVDHDFFSNNTVYTRHSDNKVVQSKNGFWENATLKIEFDVPFDLWYNNVSIKNVDPSKSLNFRGSKIQVDSLVEDLEESLKKLI